eukprot:806720-Prymnesium_polylepis.1
MCDPCMARGPCTSRDGHAQRGFGSRAWLRGTVPRGGAERRPIVGLIYRPKHRRVHLHNLYRAVKDDCLRLVVGWWTINIPCYRLRHNVESVLT